MEQELQFEIRYDTRGYQLIGDKNYKLLLPPNIPVSEFWSIIVYDALNGKIIATDQTWPSVFSSYKHLVINNDGSIIVSFGPVSQEEKKINWIKTIPGKRWYLIFRLYYPLEAWFDKSWRPGEIEEVV
jgi:hypothetical protein